MTREEGTLRVGVTQLRAFAQALADALHDIEVERELHQGISCLYDVDVVLNVIKGLTDTDVLLGNSAIEIQSPRVAVRALMSGQLLGPLRLVRAHVLELERKVRNWPNPHASLAEGFHRAQQERLTQLWGLRQHESELRAILGMPGREAVGRFQDLVEQCGYDLFVKLELCFGGTWQHRLTRLSRAGLLRFGTIDPAHDQFEVQSPTVQRLLGEIRRVPGRERATLNNVIDAAALGALHRLLAARTGQLVRFYSETSAVRRLFDTGIGQQVLRYHWNGARKSPLRTAEYFLLRASFASLAFAGHPANGRRGGATDELGDFQGLSRELTGLLVDGQDEKTMSQALTALRIGQVPVGELVTDFFRLRFLERALRGMDFPDDLAVFLPSLASALGRDDLTSGATRHVAGQSAAIRKQLAAEVGRLGQWHRHFLEILPAVSGWHLAVGGLAYRPRLGVDLGLDRWGLTETLADPETLDTLLVDLLEHDSQGRSVAEERAAELAIRVALFDGSDQGEFETLVCTTWLLQCHRALSAIWQEGHRGIEHGSELEAGLYSLWTVSRIKQVTIGQETGVEAAMDTLRVLLVDLAERFAQARGRPRLHYAMGYAHAAYWAWRRVVTTMTVADRVGDQGVFGLAQTNPHAPPVVRAWIEDSFRAAWEVAKAVPPGVPQGAFAMNHCAYVGTLAGIRPDDTRACWKALLHVERLHAHYRFADTLALPFSLEADYIVRSHGVAALTQEPTLAPQRKRACQLVQNAVEYLERGKPFLGDEEVSQHYQDVTYLQAQLRCGYSVGVPPE